MGGLRKVERCGIASARTGLHRYHGSLKGELGIIGGKHGWPRLVNVALEQRMINVSLDTFPPCCGNTVPWLLFISIIMHHALISQAAMKAYCRACWKVADAEAALREGKGEIVTVTSTYMSQENT